MNFCCDEQLTSYPLQIVELDLSSVLPSVSGPKRPHDRVSVQDMKVDFAECLNNKVGFKGFGIPADKQTTQVPFTFNGQQYQLSHGMHSFEKSTFLVTNYLINERKPSWEL